MKIFTPEEFDLLERASFALGNICTACIHDTSYEAQSFADAVLACVRSIDRALELNSKIVRETCK